jgi:signal transduction histidine kinase
MRIRTQFAAMVVGITLIPVLLLGLGWVVFSTNQNPERIPAYEQLPPESVGLISQANWSKIRDLLSRRPREAQVFVFDQSYRLIYSAVRVPGIPPGRAVAADQMLNQLKTPGRTQDVVAFQPADTKVWIVGLFAARDSNPDPFPGLLWFAGTVLSAILLFAILFSIVMGGNLTRSIVLLERAVRRLAEGDLESQIVTRGSDEIQGLGRSFEQLRQSLKEETARQSRFVMGVSHDLKSPLALVKGYVELLRDGPVTPEARQAHFDLILDKTDQLDDMIDHLIDYGKVNTGEWQQTWTDVPFKAFLAEFAQGLIPDAVLLGRTLTAHLELPDELTVACDERSVRRCLENLVHNALRYTPEGSTVWLDARRLPNAVEVTVRDNGPGVAAHDLPHLFELFYRGSGSRREPGMGLGLSIVKTILDSHGWTIRAEAGPGARFVITIPTEPDPLP